MATANMTVSLDPAVIALAKAQAAQHGMPASAWVAKLIRDAAVVEAARRYEEFERSGGTDMSAWDAAQVEEQSRRWSGAEW